MQTDRCLNFTGLPVLSFHYMNISQPMALLLTAANLRGDVKSKGDIGIMSENLLTFALWDELHLVRHNWCWTNTHYFCGNNSMSSFHILHCIWYRFMVTNWSFQISQTNLVTELVNPSYAKHYRYRGFPLRKHSSISWSLNNIISKYIYSYNKEHNILNWFVLRKILFCYVSLSPS